MSPIDMQATIPSIEIGKKLAIRERLYMHIIAHYQSR